MNLNKKIIEKSKKYYGVVYKLTNIKNNKSYIGQTTNLLARIRQYVYESKKLIYANRPISIDIFNYKLHNFTIDILDFCSSIDELNMREKYWICYHNTLVPNGYNYKIGGDNYIRTSGRNHTLEEIYRQSIGIIAYKDDRYMSFYSGRVFGDCINAPRTHITRAAKHGILVKGFFVFYQDPIRLKNTVSEIEGKIRNNRCNNIEFLNLKKKYIELAKCILNGSVEIIEPYLIEINM